MNLFILDENPELAAQGLDDKRVGKLLMEAVQMCSTAAHRYAQTAPDTGPGLACRPSYQGHPVTLWVGATRSNWCWAIAHAQALADEFALRFGKTHATEDRIPYVKTLQNCIPDGPLLQFQNSARNLGVGVDFSDYDDVVLAYRNYIIERWKTDKRPATFTNREWPEWIL